MPLWEFPMGKTTAEKGDLEIDVSSAFMAIAILTDVGRLPMRDATMEDSHGQKPQRKGAIWITTIAPPLWRQRLQKGDATMAVQQSAKPHWTNRKQRFRNRR